MVSVMDVTMATLMCVCSATEQDLLGVSFQYLNVDA